MLHQRIDRPALATRPRLEGIEALRGLAAAAVVLCHAARHVDLAFGAPTLLALLRPGHSGVDLFFVLSGFIILLVHRSDVDRPAAIARYARRRFVRVWPLYWLALGVTIAMRAAGGDAPPDVGALAWSAALLPTGEPILGIAWTLQYEAAFYLLFGLMLIDRRLGAAMLGGWLAIVVLAGVAGRDAGPVAGSFAVEFFFGMGAAMLVARGGVPRPALVAAVGGTLFAFTWGLESAAMLDGYGMAARIAYGGAAAVLVAGVAAMRARARVALTRLGAASYSIYLFHLAGMGAAWQLLTRLGVGMPPAGWLVVLAGGGIAGGLVVHRLVERPLLARFRR